jgi:putative ATP-dependent endonuclease of OLD family
MRIESVRIQNFRSCADVTVPFNDYTCLVGPNGAGKSNVLQALNIFFRYTDNPSLDASILTDEDFHKKNTAEPIIITVTFTDLKDEAEADFADYARQGKLVVSSRAEFDTATRRAEVRQYGQRLGMRDFAEYFTATKIGAKASELQTIYENVRTKYPDLPAGKGKDVMQKNLRAFEDARADLCTLLRSEDQFYGFSKGTNLLDKHIQWVYVPAVKDATSEQAEAKNNALGALVARTVRLRTKFDDRLKSIRDKTREDYNQLLEENQTALDDVSRSLQTRLAEWAHPDASIRLQWAGDPDKSVQVQQPFARIVAGEDAFEGELVRFGHGLQRSYLLALLQELATVDSGDRVPRLILACEEPELYQHPPQARHLADVLSSLSKANSQVMVCSHSPFFVTGEGFENVQMIRKDPDKKCSTVAFIKYSEILADWKIATGENPRKPEGVLAKIHQELQPALNEMFFTNRLVLVEGLEDFAYITTYFNLLDMQTAFRRSGCHIVPTGGKNHMVPALLVAKKMGIPTMLVFDSDADESDPAKRIKHENDNKALLGLCGVTAAPLPSDNVWDKQLVMWKSKIGDVVEEEIGKGTWQRYQERADVEYGQAGNLNKNTLHVATRLKLAWDDGHRSESLERLCNEILSFGGVAKTVDAGRVMTTFGD